MNGVIFIPGARGLIPIITSNGGGGPMCWTVEQGCSAIQIGVAVFLVLATIGLIGFMVYDVIKHR